MVRYSIGDIELRIVCAESRDESAEKFLHILRPAAVHDFQARRELRLTSPASSRILSMFLLIHENLSNGIDIFSLPVGLMMLMRYLMGFLCCLSDRWVLRRPRGPPCLNLPAQHGSDARIQRGDHLKAVPSSALTNGTSGTCSPRPCKQPRVYKVAFVASVFLHNASRPHSFPS